MLLHRPDRVGAGSRPGDAHTGAFSDSHLHKHAAGADSLWPFRHAGIDHHHRDIIPDCNPYLHADAEHHTHAVLHTDPFAYTFPTFAYEYRYANQHAHFHADPYAYADIYPDFNTHSDVNPNADRYACPADRNPRSI